MFRMPRDEKNTSKQRGGNATSSSAWHFISRGKGNRQQTKAGGDQNGANQRLANYMVNSLHPVRYPFAKTGIQSAELNGEDPAETKGGLSHGVNQITSRDYPGTNDVIGVALATNSVTVHPVRYWVNNDKSPRASGLSTDNPWHTLRLSHGVNGQTAWRKGEYFWSTVSTNNTSAAQLEQVTVASGGSTSTGGLFVPETPETFTYDLDGNLLSDGHWNYTWDLAREIEELERWCSRVAACGFVNIQNEQGGIISWAKENRLVAMTNNTGVGPLYGMTFTYDAKGRRIQKAVTTNGMTFATLNFLYDGWNPIAILNPQSSILTAFTWGSDLSGSQQGAGGVGGLLTVSYRGTTTTNCFVAYDGNGNVASLINAAGGALVANYEYGPFGEVIRSTGPMAKVNPIRFSTKYQDDESDLFYYGCRYYNPSRGTWLSRDPLNEEGGVNLYNFVLDNPLNLIDSDGKSVTAPAPPTSGLPQRATRVVTSTKIAPLPCCMTVVQVNFTITITDTKGDPLVGAYTTESVSILAEAHLLSRHISTGAASTHPGGILYDTYQATFWTCSGPAFVDLKQNLTIGPRTATFYTDLSPTGLGLATATAAFY
ncbi:MAG: RHS repeat-associated core domain-containing protein [Negativicutes bacterium]|nr:RHS repeat-associated core domain-containing protein [Negativicutes bacterium]